MTDKVWGMEPTVPEVIAAYLASHVREFGHPDLTVSPDPRACVLTVSGRGKGREELSVTMTHLILANGSGLWAISRPALGTELADMIADLIAETLTPPRHRYTIVKEGRGLALIGGNTPAAAFAKWWEARTGERPRELVIEGRDATFRDNAGRAHFYGVALYTN